MDNYVIYTVSLNDEDAFQKVIGIKNINTESYNVQAVKDPRRIAKEDQWFWAVVDLDDDMVLFTNVGTIDRFNEATQDSPHPIKYL